jgi:hypothetical protein
MGYAVLTGCAVLGLLAAMPRSSLAGLTVQTKHSKVGLQATYTNEKGTIHFRTLRTRTRVSAAVTGADGTVLMSVEGNRKEMPQVTFAGIAVTDHGDFSPEEESAIRALRVSPQALALGDMLRALPKRSTNRHNPWAALHELYHFLTFIGGPEPDGLYNWEETPENESGNTLTVHAAAPMICDDCGGGGDPPPPPPPPPTPPGTAWMCPGDADQCIGKAGPMCWGTYLFGTRVHKWLCESLRHDINYPQRDCTVNNSSTTGGCCGTLEDGVTALLTKPDLGRDGLSTCTLNANCPSPAACCSEGPIQPNGCHLPGGLCREIEYCDPNGNPGSTRVWPCPNEASAGAKYLVTTYNPDYSNGNLLRADAQLVTLTEPGRIVMGISCIATGYGILRVGDDSALCQVYGKCAVADLLTLDQAFLDNLHANYPGDLPFYHICREHHFGWYETANIPAGNWLVFAQSDSRKFGLIDGHGTADVFAYVGNGGINQATWAPNSCRLNVDINNTRFFVRQQYRDFLNREPEPSSAFGGARDFGAGGWQFWIEQVANSSRAQVALAFMVSGEFIAAHPALDPGSIGTPSYNEEFIQQSYKVFLRRDPDQGGHDFWLGILNSDNNYAHIIDAFISSGEYLHRAACSFGPYYCY